MIYILHLTSHAVTFRLQKNGQWRKCNFSDRLTSSDFTSENHSEIIQIQQQNIELELEGISYKINPTVSTLNDNILSYEPRVLRKTFPPIPALEQLRDVISNGDDNHLNSLILNVTGQFELRQVPPYDWFLADPTVIVRHESFAPGNNYVGNERAEDEEFCNSLYLDSLNHWKMHLISGETNIYTDYHSEGDVDTLLEEINNINRAWREQY